MDGLILQSFVATLAGIYCASSISNYVAVMRAWHIVHRVGWNISGPDIDLIIKGAKAMAPPTSTQERRELMTIE